MTSEFVISMGRMAVETVFFVSMPMLLSAMVIGLIVSIFQAATQINEQTMTFIPKVAGVLISLVICAPWMLQKLISFTQHLFEAITKLGG